MGTKNKCSALAWPGERKSLYFVPKQLGCRLVGEWKEPCCNSPESVSMTIDPLVSFIDIAAFAPKDRRAIIGDVG